ncbi:MAG: energy-coupled thiamine transporter ThiT [Clostridia bacterium]|nr:energy-coupled thiamine transporter ThiT [Clostridia bacterium]
MFNLLAGYAADAFEPYAIWITVGIFGALFVAGVIIALCKKDFFKTFFKFAIGGFFAYALVVGIVMLILEIVKHYDPAYLDENYVSKEIVTYVFIPILATLILALINGIILLVVAKKNPSKIKPVTIAAGIVCGAALIVAIVMIALYFSHNIVGGGYYDDYGELNSLALYLSAGLLIVAAIVVAFIIGRRDKAPFDTRCIAFAGIAVALSFTLSYVKLWAMPQGGSVTLASMLPIMIFAFVYGPKKGVLIGLIYGVLQAIQDPYIVHPAQFLLDYPVAFSMVGFAGALKYVKGLNKFPQIKFALSAIIGATLRFVCHVLSGVFAFGAYAKDAGASSLWLYSLGYNSFVFVDIAIVVFVGIIMFSSKTLTREIEKFNPAFDNFVEPETHDEDISDNDDKKEDDKDILLNK